VTDNSFRQRAEQTIRRYYDGCNEADVEKMRSCFVSDAVHYFPEGAPQGPFRGATAIAEGWQTAVNTLGSSWVIERLAIDEHEKVAILEWTHYKPKEGIYLRGDEWFEFSDEGFITEIRAYYAAPTASAPRVHELGSFPYNERKYSQGPGEYSHAARSAESGSDSTTP
jgi:hypothetical protein